MSKNAELADRFEQIAQLLEITGADPFRVRSHQRVARVLEGLSDDVERLAKDRTALLEIDGVGHKTADKIEEYFETGKITELEDLKKKVPPGLIEVMRVPGIGPKKAKAIWDELGVESLADLKKAIDDGTLSKVPRMGAKTVENIASAIDFASKTEDRAPLGVALPLAEALVERLSEVKGVSEVAYAGSLRRGRDTIGDIDILACGSDERAIAEAFREMDGVTEVLAAGKTKSSVRMKADKGPPIQVDLRVVPKSSFGAAMLYFTGSKAHNVRLRERAIKNGQTLNEYGLFPESEKSDEPPQKRGVKPLASRTEEAIYKALHLPYLPPEIREDRGECDLGETPDLIEVDDIKAELHAHTTASDGALSIEKLAAEAKRRGFHTVAVTDHSKTQSVANGLDADRLRAHAEAVRKADKATKGIRILAGTEVDVMPDGRLDYDDELLELLDIVVASPHWSLQQKPEKATARLLKAIEHPLVDILGHPTGRLINRRGGLAPDMSELIGAAVEHETALEINAHWMRLDLRDTHVRAAVEAGALIAIDCDVHNPADFDNLRFGVLTGRRGRLTAERCVNAWSAKKLHGWLKRRRGG